MIKITQKGNFSKTTRFLNMSRDAFKRVDLEKYGQEGVAALSAATPRDSGETASSWYYVISKHDGVYKISFCNSNVVGDVPVAILIEYGHGTRNGGWVEGTNYIAPAIQPVLEKIAENAWKEVVGS